MKRLQKPQIVNENINIAAVKADDRITRITPIIESELEIVRLASNCQQSTIDPKTGKEIIDKKFRNNIEKWKPIKKSHEKKMF
jgi:hypothetical protein